jgi:hypothetical protein
MSAWPPFLIGVPGSGTVGAPRFQPLAISLARFTVCRRPGPDSQAALKQSPDALSFTAQHRELQDAAHDSATAHNKVKAAQLRSTASGTTTHVIGARRSGD